jgi:flagellar hook-associated protein 3 FlgL
MQTTFISTLSLWNSPRSAVNKMQAELAKANEEIATGRYADVGLELGYRTGDGITLRQERAEIEALIDGNGTVSLRLSATKNSLDYMRTSAEKFLSSLLSVPPLERGAETVRDTAKTQLETFVSELNRSAGGQYIFGGTNTKHRPVNEYFTTPASPAKAALDAAFFAEFGVTQNDPGAFAITAAQMTTFLNTDFATLFDDTNWAADWSSASSQNMESKISLTEKVETSTNANETAMRQLAMAYTMLTDLGIVGLRTETQQVLVDKAMELLGSATYGITKIQADLGIVEKQVTEANTRMASQKNIFDLRVADLEEVDPAEAKARVDAYTTQIQMSYSLTSQLRQLNLLNYL